MKVSKNTKATMLIVAIVGLLCVYTILMVGGHRNVHHVVDVIGLFSTVILAVLLYRTRKQHWS